MKTYEIIADIDAVNQFIQWLPDCEEHEQFYCCLFMRKKYCPDVKWIKSDKGQLRRFTTTKERFFDKIAQLECKLGAFKFDGKDVPQESLALYVSVNPRDLWRATVRSIGQLAKVLECNGKNSNPHQEVISEIQRTAGTRKYITFDIDQKDDKLLEECINYCDGMCDVLETRGGYHLHVHKDKVDRITDKQGWYKNLSSKSDQSGDMMSPVAGTMQGMFVPKFIYRCKE
jgi:hypothetical protein